MRSNEVWSKLSVFSIIVDFRCQPYLKKDRLSVKIELGTILKALMAKGLHRPGLAYLSGALEQYWLSSGLVFPCLKGVDNVPFNLHLYTFKCGKM